MRPPTTERRFERLDRGGKGANFFQQRGAHGGEGSITSEVRSQGIDRRSMVSFDTRKARAISPTENPTTTFRASAN